MIYQTTSSFEDRKPFIAWPLSLFRRLMGAQLFILLVALVVAPVLAQQQSGKRQKLPSPDKIVNDYLKAIGGKKRVAAIKDATFEWRNQAQPEQGVAVSQIKAPASTRLEVSNGDALRTTTAANARSAWLRASDGRLSTLTDAEANAAKLQAALDASHLINYKKLSALARTVALNESESEPAYVVEFSSRNGARLRYWFGSSSKLLLKITDEAREMETRFADYRAESNVLEPHRIEIKSRQMGAMTFLMQSARYNTGLSDALFDPPGAEQIDVAALLREVERNQERLEDRVSDYTYLEKRTERKINGRGEVTEEIIKVFEIYPLPNQRPVRKLVSENGAVLPADKAAKEEKRVTEELEKAERERAKAIEKRERDEKKGKTEKKADDDPGIADFIRSAELVSPRRETLRGREAIVFDFRPRAGYKPKGDIESVVSKLTGVVWIDPVDKQVMRLEAKLVESYKMGGGLLASIRPGTAFVFEQKRMDDGVWLPVFTQANISAKILLFKGIDLNVQQEFSNYQRFNSDLDNYKLTAPDKQTEPPASQP